MKPVGRHRYRLGMAGWVKILGGFVLLCSVVAVTVRSADEGLASTARIALGDASSNYIDEDLQLGAGTEILRVRFTLAHQPVIEVARSREFRNATLGVTTSRVRRAASDSPSGILDSEVRHARMNRRLFDVAVDGLEPAAREAGLQQAALMRKIIGLGGRVLGSESIPSSVIAQLSRDDALLIARTDEVASTVMESEARPALNTAMPVVGVPAWWAAGHIGGGGSGDVSEVVVGLLNDPVLPSHPAFSGLVVENDPTDPPLDVSSGTQHGTHVGGVVASRDMQYRGVAPGLGQLNAGNTNFLLGLPTSTCCPQVNYPGASSPADVINWSAGSEASNDDADITRDALAEIFGVGYATVAGNSMSEGINHTGLNMMVVGGSTRGTADPLGPAVVNGSSRGPTPGGRKKPDLVAPYTVTAPSSHWARMTVPCSGGFLDPDGSCVDFTTESGTSLSAPFVAGSMALLEAAGISDPKVQRAILINSARPICNPGPCQTGWEPAAGWGMLDMDRAFAERGFFDVGEVKGNSAAFYRLTASTPGQRATLAWNLRAFLPVSAGNTHTVSNLDLHQFDAETFEEVAPPGNPGHGGGPDALDTNDTVEQVRSPGSGEFILKVRAASPVVGAAAEPFAIAAGSAIERLDAPAVRPIDVTVSAAGSVNCFESTGEVTISAVFENTSGDFEAESAEAMLDIPSGVVLVSGSTTQTIGDGSLDPDQASGALSWVVRAATSGTKNFTISSSGQTLGETFIESEGASFVADCRPPQVQPTGISVTPADNQRCGAVLTVTASFENPTATVATGASASLNLPSGLVFVSGAATQPVSGGALPPGTTSAPLTWEIRPALPGTRTFTVEGSGTDGSSVFTYPVTRQVTCSLVPTSMRLAKPERKRNGKFVVVSGQVSATDPLSGKVRIVLKGHKKKRVARAPVKSSGSFRKRLKMPGCKKGKYRISITFEGTVSLESTVAERVFILRRSC